MWEKAPPDTRADAWLLQNFSGLSPLVCGKWHFGLSATSIPERPIYHQKHGWTFTGRWMLWLTLVEQASFQPVMLLESGRPRDFCFMPITQYGTSVTAEAYSDFSALLDAFYTRRDKEESIRRRSRELTRTVKNTLERLMRKISAQENELLATRNKEEFRWKGDMITANLYRLEKGMASFTAQDYYHEPCLDVPYP